MDRAPARSDGRKLVLKGKYTYIGEKLDLFALSFPFKKSSPPHTL